MSKSVSIDWFWTPLFLLMIATSSCSIAEDVKDMKNHLVNAEKSGDNNAGIKD